VGALRLDCGTDGVACAREGEEERVALVVDLDPVHRLEGRPDESTMRREQLAVEVAELLQQLRRALDVGEDERDRSARERGHRPRSYEGLGSPRVNRIGGGEMRGIKRSFAAIVAAAVACAAGSVPAGASDG